MKYPKTMFGVVEAVWNKLGGEEGVNKFLRGELTLYKSTHLWRELDGVIYFSVTSDGTTGPQWIERLEKKGFKLTKSAKDVLNSPDFKPTDGVTTEIAVLKGMLFAEKDCITSKIRAEAETRKLTKLGPEASCLIREMFSDEELKVMNLWGIVVMHEPIEDSDRDPFLLYSGRGGDGSCLHACYDRPGLRWNREDGFVFLSRKFSSQN